MIRLRAKITTLVFLFALCGLGSASDFYISPNGSDAEGDGTSDNPWRTITFAVVTVEGTETDPTVIHAAAGNYGSGETFPIRLGNYEILKGDYPEPSIIHLEFAESTLFVFDGVEYASIELLQFEIGNTVHYLPVVAEITRSFVEIVSCKACALDISPITGFSGGLVRMTNGTLIIDHCEFSDNALYGIENADISGSILYASDSDIEVIHSRFIDNRLTSGCGYGAGNCRGGVLDLVNCHVSIRTSLFSGNGADAAHCYNFGTFTGDAKGGAIALTACSGNIQQCRFIGNEARGGGFEEHNVHFTLVGGNGQGGAVYSDSVNLIFRDCRFDNNLAKGGDIRIFEYEAMGGNGEGGAIYGRASFSNNLFTGNRAEGGVGICDEPDLCEAYLWCSYGGSAGGGAIRLIEQTDNAFNTFYGNTAAGGVGSNGSGTMAGSTISFGNWKHCIVRGGDALTAEATFSYSNLSSWNEGEGNQTEDPLFTSGPYGYYYLSNTAAGQTANSPCIDAGDPDDPAPEGTTRTDHYPDSGSPDIGFHYFEPDTSPTPYPTKTPDYTPTPTPAPTPVLWRGVRLICPDTELTGGDQFQLRAMCMGDSEQAAADLYVILDIYGSYWFYPGWTVLPGHETIELNPLSPVDIFILDFTWPDDVSGCADDLKFWGAILDYETGGLIGDYDVVDFEYH